MSAALYAVLLCLCNQWFRRLIVRRRLATTVAISPFPPRTTNSLEVRIGFEPRLELMSATTRRIICKNRIRQTALAPGSALKLAPGTIAAYIGIEIRVITEDVFAQGVCPHVAIARGQLYRRALQWILILIHAADVAVEVRVRPFERGPPRFVVLANGCADLIVNARHDCPLRDSHMSRKQPQSQVRRIVSSSRDRL